MKIFIAIFALFLGVENSACTEFQRNRVAEFSVDSSNSDAASSANDKHATTANRVMRQNSFQPSHTSSNRDYFREKLNRHEGPNDYGIESFYTNYSPFKQRKPQSEIHLGSSFRGTRDIQVKQGRLSGVVREFHVQSRLKNVDQFLGIPYAEAPVGSRRFMPPSSPLPWVGVKHATKHEAVCPQKLPNLNDPSGFNKGRYDQIKRLLPYLKKESEDCLYLNLYVTSYGELLMKDENVLRGLLRGFG